jgi:hypothetical protein
MRRHAFKFEINPLGIYGKGLISGLSHDHDHNADVRAARTLSVKRQPGGGADLVPPFAQSQQIGKAGRHSRCRGAILAVG